MRRTTYPTLSIGDKFEVVYPFYRSEMDAWDEDGPHKVKGWTPGCDKCERSPEGDTHRGWIYWADGLGRQLLTVVGLCKPEGFPQRVFFTRKWIDPDGKQFGKNKCRVTSISAFRVLCRGYRYEFDIEEAPVNAG